ncbi:hypothetical protein [Roseateles sp.]|uniref:hypothetical protein n=1 Tax=Roseateles sp. TaxID=1971397 RepID=UPI00286AAE97|nr:hypothetical protein [Roseateles sp.]
MNKLNSACDARQSTVRRRGLAMQISPVAAACALLLVTAQAAQAQVASASASAPAASQPGAAEQLDSVDLKTQCLVSICPCANLGTLCTHSR